MTALVATATRRAAMISQDSAVALVPPALRHGIATGFGDAYRSAFVGDGRPRDDTAVAWREEKVRLFRAARFAVGCTGTLHVHRAHLGDLDAEPPVSLDEAARLAPARLRRAYTTLPAPSDHLELYAGWSDAEDAFVIWVFSHSDDFAGVRALPGGGHTMVPPPSTDDPAYVELHGASQAGVIGDPSIERTARFHRRYMANVRRSFRRGLYGDHAVISGPFHTGCITRDEAWVEEWTLRDEPARAEAA
jgi:hypothetical protein